MEVSYKDRIKKFLEDKEDYSLLIKGKWGVGKTYLWKEIQDENNSYTAPFGEKFKKDFYFTAHLRLIITYLCNFYKTSISFLCKYFCHHDETSQPKKNMIYISLFGKESYREVLEEVIIKSCTEEFMFKLFKDLKLWNVSIGNILTLIRNKYFGQTVDFKNTVVCFDDIERKSHNFRMKDFLGLVYQLKKEKCKVIIITNIGELPKYEEEIFKKYREKSIDWIIEIESKREVIYQILKEKLKDEYYEKLFPENIYKIENLRNLKKIIRAFKFFSQEFNFKGRLEEKEELKNLFTYVFELIVTKIDTNLKGDATTKWENIVKQSEHTISNMIDDYIKNAKLHISSFMKECFEKEINNHHFYTLMKELKEKFDNIIMDKNYSDKIKKEIQNIINKMGEKEYIPKFVETMRCAHHIFCILDFLSMIEVLNLNNNITTKIRKEIIKQVPYKNNESVIDATCNNEELRKYAEELAAQLNMNADYNSPRQQKNEASKKIPLDICNYWRFKDFIEQDKNYTNEEIEEAIKDNKIILQYIRHFYDMYYKNNGDKFKEHYPILHEIWSSNKNQY